MPSLRLEGIPTDWISFFPIADELTKALFDATGWPPLKSEVILVFNKPEAECPMYLAGGAIEMIRVKVERNLPWQFGYQLAHELGHLSARSDLRHPRLDGLMWIEEALCECHSMIGMAHLARNGPRPEHALSYLNDLLSRHASPEISGGSKWFEDNSAKLAEARTLVDEAKVAARYIYGTVDPTRILSDNRRLIDLPTGLELRPFLDRWRELLGEGRSVPDAICELIGPS